MTDVPSDVRALALEREEKRKAKDYRAADDLRDRIREMGFEIVDTPTGTEFETIEPSSLSHGDDEPALHAPPVADFSVQWVIQGWPEDAARGIESFQRNAAGLSVQYVVVDAAAPEGFAWPEGVEVVRLERDFGWAAIRNAGLRRAAGRIVVVVDGSVEANGDVFGPLERALNDPGVGVCGPFGIATDDLREFHESDGPDVDAIEGYLMAFRREVLTPAGLFDEKFKFYRTADIEFSFRVKNEGLRAVVVPVPLRRYEHRMWASTTPEERERLSKRNFYRFLDRWRGRTDLTVAGKSG